MTERPALVRPPGFVVDLHGAFLRRVDLSGADLRKANLARADFEGASFRGADLKDANLKGTILRGADLREVENLTVAQLAEAEIDEETLLPGYITRDEILRHREEPS